MRPNISKMIRRISPRLPEGQQSRARWFNTCTLTTTGTRQNCASASETPVFQHAVVRRAEHDAGFPRLRRPDTVAGQ